MRPQYNSEAVLRCRVVRGANNASLTDSLCHGCAFNEPLRNNQLWAQSSTPEKLFTMAIGSLRAIDALAPPPMIFQLDAKRTSETAPHLARKLSPSADCRRNPKRERVNAYPAAILR
ncbi:hypothetical protein D918_07599 [Trichuris suis]|nr:hypothetical protein D918_07599 [Trichuris suis]